MSNEELEFLYDGESRALSFGQNRNAGAWVKQTLARPDDLNEFKAMDSDDMNKACFVLNATVTLWEITVEASEGHQTVYHGEIQYLGYGESVADGAWIKWRIADADDLQPYRDLSREKKLSKTMLNLVITRGDIIPAEDEPENKIYGKHAQALYGSNVLITPQVLNHIGTDDDYAEYIRNMKCLVCHKGDWNDKRYQMICDPAHVRRASTDGIAFKGDYTPRVPLCREHHQYQHAHGEDALYAVPGNLSLNPKTEFINPGDGREWMESHGYKYLHEWARDTLKKTLGYQSWAQVPPEVLREWWNEHDLPVTMLPRMYRV